MDDFCKVNPDQDASKRDRRKAVFLLKQHKKIKSVSMQHPHPPDAQCSVELRTFDETGCRQILCQSCLNRLKVNFYHVFTVLMDDYG